MSRSFLKIMESEIEPVIKELSSCLLYPETASHDLERCLHKFETAIANMRERAAGSQVVDAPRAKAGGSAASQLKSRG